MFSKKALFMLGRIINMKKLIRYIVRVTIVDKVENKKEVQDFFLKKGFEIISIAAGKKRGNKRFESDLSKIRIIGEREVTKSDVINKGMYLTKE